MHTECLQFKPIIEQLHLDRGAFPLPCCSQPMKGLPRTLDTIYELNETPTDTLGDTAANNAHHFIIMRVEGKHILVVLLLCFLAETATSGSSDCEVECCRGCEESFVGTISKTHVNYTQLRSRASSYYVSCGFWGWGSCKKYRLRYYIYKTYKTLYYKTVGMKCDPGCQCVQRVSVGPLPILFLSSNATTSNVTTATSTTPGGN